MTMHQLAALLTLTALAPSCLGDGPGNPPNPAGRLHFSAATFSVNESGPTASFVVRRSGGSVGAVSVLYTVADGTATAPADYAVPPGTGMLIWGDGDAADKTIQVNLVDDGDEEPNETLLATIHTPSGATLGTPSGATLTIIDNDSSSPAGTVRFDPDKYSFYEGIPALALLAPNVVTVTRTGGSTGAVSVMVLISGGTATQDADYRVSIPGPLAGVVLSWADGDSAPKSFIVDVIDDNLREGDETIQFTLSNPTGGVLIGAPGDATVTLLDDE
jgi:hypothetical protein